MLRLLEHYVSVQGECDNVGVPTQFIRFAGCNLRCPEWPCDTPFAIEPKLYRHEQEFVPVQSTANHPNGLLNRIFQIIEETGAENICLTGGEPMLQPGSDLIELVRNLNPWIHPDRVYTSVEMFSNGTLPYPDEILDLCFVRMDWKLPGSGEDSDNPQRIENYYALQESDQNHTIKFTIKNLSDFEVARDLFEKYDMASWPGRIYAGPVWASDFTAKDIVDGILTYKLPWRLNTQMHNYIYPAHERRR